jgi:PAS domain S-box-containing protein
MAQIPREFAITRLSADDSREPSLLARYVVALLASALALLLTWLLQPFMQRNLFLWFFPAMVISALYGGLGPGLLVTLIASLSIGYFFIPPLGSFAVGTEELLRLGIFALVALLISSLTAARRRSAISAQAQREQLRVTLSSIGDAVIATDVDGRVTLMNTVAETLTGWDSAALGQPITDVFRIVNETTRQAVESPVERALREGRVVGLANHTLLIARDGTERPIDDSGAPIRDRQGRVIGVVLVFRDITARRQIEAAQAQLAAIVQSSDDAIIGKRLDGTIISWNAAAEQIYGYRADEVIGRSIQLLAPPDRPNEVPEILERIKRGERIAQLETVRVRKDQALIDVSLTISPILATNGAITAASTIARDISERKQAARRSDHMLTIATALSEALTQAQVAEVFVSHGVAASSAHAGALALLSQDGDSLEIIGAIGYSAQAIDSWRRLSLSQAAPLTEAVRSKTPLLIESPAALAERYPWLVQQAQPDHRAWAVIPLLVEGRVSGALGLSFSQAHAFSADERAFLLTLASQYAQALERARLYEAERQARAQAEAAVRLRDQFLSIAAHELKTPLTSLLGYAQLFQRRALRASNLGEADQRALDVIVAQTARLNRMVAALLDVARIESGQLSITRASLDLCDLARRVVEEAREQAEQHPLEIICESKQLIIDGDDLRLEQVLQNLIQNAIKYSPPGAPVSVRIERQGALASVAVVDHGIGIPEAALAQLFQRFYRAPNVDERQISGMGIGLFVVKEIVLLHNGTVAVESVEGQGSTFTIRLPLATE